MTAQTPAPIGHNNPPEGETPLYLLDILAPFADDLQLAKDTLCGLPVENDGQLKSVEALLKTIKAAKKALEAEEEARAKPIYEAWKAQKAVFAPHISDADKKARGLAAMTEGYKKKLAAQKAEQERLAREEAARLKREAEEAMRTVDKTDLDAVVEAERLAQTAKDAKKTVADAVKERGAVKGLRKVVRHEITDMRALINHIARNDKPAMAAFAAEWARLNAHPSRPIEGVRAWEDQVAY